MSAGGLVVPYPGAPSGQPAPGGRHQLWLWAQRLGPRQGWATLLFLLATLLVVGDSVNAADWVDTPGLLAALVWSAVTGLLLARIRAPALLLHLSGLGIGFVVVVWQTSSLIENEPLAEQIQQLWSRLNVWYDAATSGGISTDEIAFTLVLLALAWLLGYVSSWFIFRRSNVWVAVVLGGTALLTNLSLLPDKFASRFFLFAFCAMLLVVRMSVVQNQEAWRKSGIEFSSVTGWLTIHAAVWFGVAVMLLAALLPMRVVVSRTFADAWRTGRAPVQRLEDEFARLFGAIPSRKDVSGRFFGQTLPFLGKISFGGEPVLWAQTDYPSYWLSQTYSQYTPQGWIAGETKALEVGPETISPPRTDSLKRVPVDQTIQLGFDTSNLLSGGSLDWVSRNAVVETLVPKEFVINLGDPATDSQLPEDIQRVAQELRDLLASTPIDLVESHISRNLPRDLVLARLSPDVEERRREGLESVTLARKEPIVPDVVAWNLTNHLSENDAYSIVSFVSLATDDDLRKADTDYNGFVRDHYLQLPDTLPERVRDLAEQITQGAETPLDKGLAIQGYLRGPDFVYSQDIEAPPFGSDGVDHFLFETRTGYSDYFASAMVVMLRAVEVPSRLSAGYAPGEYDSESGRRIVKDSDSHGWTQVYFPKYGWIDFEPTPNWPAHERRLITGPGSLDFPGRLSDSDLGEGEDIFDPDIEEAGLEGLVDVAAVEDPWNPVGLIIGTLIAAGVLAAIWVISRTLWMWGLAQATPIERTYTKMTRLGALAGIGRRLHQTPGDYAAALGSAVPSVAPAAKQVAWAFASNRYGGPQAAEHDQEELEQTWMSMRGSLLARALARFTRIGSGGR